MNCIPLDLHLDEDSRFALTDDEMNLRLQKFKDLEKQAIIYDKNEKKILNEIKRLTLRLESAKKSSTKKSLTKKIEALRDKTKRPEGVMTLKQAKESKLLYDLRFEPGQESVPLTSTCSAAPNCSFDDSDFYFKHEDLIKSLNLLNPENPPSLYQKLAEERRKYRLKQVEHKNTFYEDNILPRVSLAGWVKTICRISRAVPTLVQLIDNEVNWISRSPEDARQGGVSTVRLLERFTSRLRLKEQYLNIFVFSKELEQVLKTKFERQVYDCFIKKCKKVKNTIDPKKVRTAYRHKNDIVLKMVRATEKHGYNKEWFQNHFGDLPPVKKLLIDEFEREVGRVKLISESEGEVVSQRENVSAEEKIVFEPFDPKVAFRMDDNERYEKMNPWELLGMTREEFYME